MALAWTVTEHVAFFPPSFVVTVIVAEPAALAVTSPEDETVATEVLLEDQLTDLSVALDGVTVADNVCESPTVMVRDVWFRVTPVTAIGFTVTEQVAFFPPSSVVAVITAVPSLTADTLPFESTVAMFVLELVHDTFLFVALEGKTVAVSFSVPPMSKVSEVLFNDIPVTATVFAWTVTEHVAFFPPSVVVTVIVAEPAVFAVTTPDVETVATEVLLEDQVTVLSVAFDGVTVAIRVWKLPSTNVKLVLSRLNPVTATVFAFTATEHTAVSAPSTVFTVIIAVPAAFAVTTPEEDTVATAVLSDVHVTDLFVAFDGFTVAVNACVSPSVIVRLVLSRLTPVTGITFALTVTSHTAVLPPSSVLTVILDVPIETAVMIPVADTDATKGLLDIQITSFSDAFHGLIVYFMV